MLLRCVGSTSGASSTWACPPLPCCFSLSLFVISLFSRRAEQACVDRGVPSALAPHTKGASLARRILRRQKQQQCERCYHRGVDLLEGFVLAAEPLATPASAQMRRQSGTGQRRETRTHPCNAIARWPLHGGIKGARIDLRPLKTSRYSWQYRTGDQGLRGRRMFKRFGTRRRSVPLGEKILAVAVGCISGYYIFAEPIRQAAQQQHLEQALKQGNSAQVTQDNDGNSKTRT